jgi:hypothetical protein
MAESFYFPFPDGRIGYDCVACGFQCCKGHGFAATKTELEGLKSLRPEVEAFAFMGWGKLNAEPNREIPTFIPNCFFLQSDGQCEVEVTLGRPRKPWVCRLYPVNDIYRIGSHYVFNFHVIGNGILCPFTVGSTGRRIRYSDLEADLVGWESHPARAFVFHSEGLDGSAAELIRNETEIREALAGLKPGASALEALAVGSGRSTAEAEARLGYFASLFEVEFPALAHRTEQTETLAAFLPSLRISYLAHLHRQGYERGERFVKDYLLQVYLYANAASTLWRSPLSGATLIRIADQMRNVFHLACLLESRVTFSLPEETQVTFRVDSPASLGLIHLLRKGDRRPLWEIIGDSMETPNFTMGDAVPCLGALQPLAPYLF